MNELAILQALVGSMFGLALFVKMWEHSISTFLMLLSGTLSLFLYEVDACTSMGVFGITTIYVTLRGAMKPKGERLWR